MPKKPKLDKQLDRLFKGFRPEETALEERRTRTAELEASVRPEQSSPQIVSGPPPTARPVKRHTATLVLPEPLITQQTSENASPPTIR